MAELDRRAGTGASAASVSYGRGPAPVPTLLQESTEPMQQALDDWYRREPEAFTRSEELKADDPASAAGQALTLHHLLAYGRLAGERELERLRSQAANDGSPVLAPLLQGLAKRQTELVIAAPIEIRGAVEQGLVQSADRLGLKAATIEGLAADRKRAGSLEQSIQLGEALLREDPDQYERLLADAEALTAALAPEPHRQQAMTAVIRRRYATAALEAEIGPAGDPARVAEDLAAGRFRDAFDDEATKAWCELVIFQQERRAAETTLAAQDAGIAVEAKLLTRLGAAGRGEAPMPSLAEIEAVFPGEGAKRLAVAEQNRKRLLYGAQIALRPFDKDQAWIEAGDDGDDTLLRAEIVGKKQQQVERGDWETLQRQYPTLAGAIEAGIEDPAKLSDAVELYQRHLMKLGVPPEKRWLLPDEALSRIASRYEDQIAPADRLQWLQDLADSAGGEEARTIVRALSQRVFSFDRRALPALDALLDPDRRDSAVDIIKRSTSDEDFIEGSRLEVRLNPDTGKYEDVEISPRGHERIRPRRYAGAYFEVQERTDPRTGERYNVEIFADGSERPRLPAGPDYPALRGAALEAWRQAAHDQVVNPATWPLAQPASERFQRYYQQLGMIVPDFYFVGPNGVVYERSDITEEPASTQALRWLESEAAEEQFATDLDASVEERNFRGYLDLTLLPAVAAGIGRSGGARPYKLLPYKGSLNGINGYNVHRSSLFKDYLIEDRNWRSFRDAHNERSSESYRAANAVWMKKVGLSFQNTVRELFRRKGYLVENAWHLEVEGTTHTALPDGSVRDLRSGTSFLLEIKAIRKEVGQFPDLPRKQGPAFAQEAAKGTTFIVVSLQGNRLVASTVVPPDLPSN